MSDGIVIIGSGFAARQLVKNIRKQDTHIPLTLIAADSMDEYNKPDLSHVVSRGQRADDLTLQTAGEFAEQYHLRLFPYTWVSDLDAAAKVVKSQDREWRYDKLVLATGAAPFIPPVPGHELMLTLNSQREYGAAQSQLHDAQRVLIVGGGLIGCELAMDFCRAGKAVTVVDNSASVLSALMPPEVSSRLQHRLTDMGVHLMLKTQLEGLEQTADGIRVSLDRQRSVTVDAVVAAAGLRPETALARHAGLMIRRGVVVNSRLQTSDPAIYALGDCAEINGSVLPFLQPILLSAMCLAKNLLSQANELTLPPMLVKVKTPDLPLHLAGETQRDDLTWNLVAAKEGVVAKGVDAANQLRAFVVSEDRMKEAFALLKQLVR
ncbi:MULTISPECIES: NADH:flavorubredoxin reductase NorW [Raoultella]|jgi:nitric oxide reductase FlRd-NAD(+) reductase|uniref:NADH:flavorubredoxin reductase NorW n=1 Tax=Raoultella ornithinolytica TaxID=54291 RepID=A0ABZ2DX33_RAOOR|nr:MULTISPECIES: NADH:flavorubredoxin reductase NorW [Raoultella]HDX8332989.1 NADH:flavorubredoxin reductase NorW [Raoultella ornithinolytica CD1_MRS_4]AGJ89481.1 NADH:flavorubredoxin oxidoreductase [Raoultella ornithinolytica B6]ANZ07435.1 NADH:flavorubredoxin oxidoreductase [Raoultella ornithinolytica]AOO59297.1 NADH:flavorubredoxin oxidoreductase [Raoultella ornithinolytica]APB07309.1 NADH:flavorubredoxin reductase NorW [Raoultella ornithinolytica]